PRAMAMLKPFRGLRPPRQLAPRVAALPYDVVSTEEARAYARGNEHCFFHISRPEIGLPVGVDEHGERVYELGRENLRLFEQRGWLSRDTAPSFYVYRQRMGDHVQSGLVAVASLDEYDRGLIKRHELTRPDKEDDRTRHIIALGGNDEPVFLTYRARAEIDAAVKQITSGPPEYDFTAEDGIAHTFWVAGGEWCSQIADLFQNVPALYIADGHHRSAAASRARRLYAERGQLPAGASGFLSVVFPDDQVKILDYNRAVRDLRGLAAEELLAQIARRFEIAPGSAEKPSSAHQFGMFLRGRWYRLTAKPEAIGSTPAEALDVSILQNHLLSPILGVGDPRTDKRMHFVGGIRGTAELERLVASGEYQVAFALYPTRLDQLMAIADAGEIMPPKSTWFEPKLRSGLVLHMFT
ncbi:MAG TPA: DUF1015 family protein, partial [Myxococcaceae bacterium]|nr:DUF1015 family protein [Myxococcaceae bacterium]